MPNDYTTVSIPNDLYRTVKTVVNTSPRYTSISEFVKEALREKIKREIETDQKLRKL